MALVLWRAGPTATPFACLPRRVRAAAVPDRARASAGASTLPMPMYVTIARTVLCQFPCRQLCCCPVARGVCVRVRVRVRVVPRKHSQLSHHQGW